MNAFECDRDIIKSSASPARSISLDRHGVKPDTYWTLVRK